MKDLKVPKSKGETARGMQQMFCRNADCDDIDHCNECIFCYVNISDFKSDFNCIDYIKDC